MRLPEFRSVILLLLAAGTFASSCSDRRLRDELQPPPSAPLSRPLGFAVVEVAYAQIRDRPQADAVTLGFRRQGEVVAIGERRKLPSPNGSAVWLFALGDEAGWIAESDVSLYDTEAKAETAAAGRAP
jgi:hypothetical protein